MTERELKILLVEDNPDDVFLISEMLNDSENKIQMEIIHAERINKAIELIDNNTVDLILLDLSLPDSRGFDTFQKMNSAAPHKPLIILSGLNDESLAIKAVAKGAQDYFVKSQVTGPTLSRAILYAIQRKSDREVLNSSLSLLEATLEATADGIIAVSKKGEILRINNIAKKIWNLPPQLLKVKEFNTLFTALKNQFKEPGKFTKVVEELKHKDSESSDNIFELNNGKVIEAKSRPQMLDGNIVGRVWSFSDITDTINAEKKIKQYVDELQYNQEMVNRKAFELFQANQKLKDSEEELLKLNANKDKFFSIIAHDLKSPFTTFLGITSMIEEEYDEFSKEEIREFIRSINDNANNVYSLLENLLDWARIQSGRIEFDPEDFDLKKAVTSEVSVLNHTASYKGLQLINAVQPGTRVFGDLHMICTVLRNLISNAIKFTDSDGKVAVSSEQKENMIVVSIADTGKGISEKDLGKLFRIEKHFTTPGTKNEKGTGLGLVLCRELIEKNHGEIWVESKPGEGSTFFFTVPVKG